MRIITRFISHSFLAVLEGMLIAILVIGLIAGAALAAKRQGGTSGSLSIVMIDASDTLMNWADDITFDVSTTVAKPLVDAKCYQGGALVYAHSAGFFADYPWADARIFELKSTAWTGGSADCVATLYYVTKNGRSKALATLPFNVDA